MVRRCRGAMGRPPSPHKGGRHGVGAGGWSWRMERAGGDAEWMKRVCGDGGKEFFVFLEKGSLVALTLGGFGMSPAARFW
jgi:hypothetical protein